MSKTVVITGTSTGFGRDTAETLASAGHRVFATMRDPQGKNSHHAAALGAMGIYVIEMDVTQDKSVNQAVTHIKTRAEYIDVLINNAGLASAGVSEAFSPAQMSELFDVNVIGPHRVSRAILPIMRTQKSGLIINIGSILGRITFPFFGIYGASKYALEGLSDSLRYEVSQLGIDVTLVQPSAYPTNMYASAMEPVDKQCISEYGTTGEIPQAMFAQFMSMFEADNGPNLHDVAQAIVELIEAPNGKRPARKVVGTSFGADAINSAVAPIQQQTIKALGLEHLEAVNTTL